jgi:hypothetical protein
VTIEHQFIDNELSFATRSERCHDLLHFIVSSTHPCRAGQRSDLCLLGNGIWKRSDLQARRGVSQLAGPASIDEALRVRAGDSVHN